MQNRFNSLRSQLCLFFYPHPRCSLLALPRLNVSDETSTQKHKASDGLMTPTAPFLFICLFIHLFGETVQPGRRTPRTARVFVCVCVLRCAHCKHLGVAARALHACHSPPASAPPAGTPPHPPTTSSPSSLPSYPLLLLRLLSFSPRAVTHHVRTHPLALARRQTRNACLPRIGSRQPPLPRLADEEGGCRLRRRCGCGYLARRDRVLLRGTPGGGRRRRRRRRRR